MLHRRRTLVLSFFILTITLLTWGLFSFNAVAQIDPTAQAQTIEAEIARRFDATATAQANFAVTQTIDAAMNSALTATANYHVSLDAAFNMALTATAVTARQSQVVNLEHISIDNATQLEPITVFEGFAGGVYSTSFSPNGTYLSIGSGDGKVRIFDIASRSQLAIHEGYVGIASRIPFSPDGVYIVTPSYGRDGTVWVWDATNGTEISVLRGHTDVVLGASFSPDGIYVVSASQDGTARIWDAVSGLQIGLLGNGRPQNNQREGNLTFLDEFTVLDASFSPDGSRIVTAHGDGTARIWDAESGVQIAQLEGHTAVVRSALFSPDGTRIVTMVSTDNFDGTVRIWDVATGMQTAVLANSIAPVGKATFSPDSTRIVTTGGWDGKARVWDVSGGVEIAVLEGHTGVVTCATFSLDGRLIITGSEDNTIRLWDALNGTELAILTGHTDGVYSVGVSPDGAYLITAGGDSTIRLWHVNSQLTPYQVTIQIIGSEPSTMSSIPSPSVVPTSLNLTLTLIPTWTQTPIPQ